MSEIRSEPNPAPPPLDELDAGYFEPWKKSAFVLLTPAGEGVCDLLLQEVNLLGHRRPNATREPFSLQFQGSPGFRLAQGIYRLQHAQAGALEVFITQVGDGPSGSTFEVIFT